jgi:hypothetical protein
LLIRSYGISFLLPRSPSRAYTRKRCNSSEGTSRSKITTLTSIASLGSTVSILSVPQDDAYQRIVSDADAHLDPSKETSECPKKVRFSNVDLREYVLCLGDNPSVTRGAPISLDWNYKTELSYSIDDFEKSEHCSTKLGSMKRPSLERLHLLKILGYSRNQIKEATDIAQLIQNQRFKTRRQVERSDRLHAFCNAMRCFRQSSANFCDPVHKPRDSISTVSSVSTRSSIDWSTVGTDVALALSTRDRIRTNKTTASSNAISKTRSKIRRSKKQVWQQQLQQQWQQRTWQIEWQRTPRDSLDMAHHKSSIVLGAIDNVLGDVIQTKENECTQETSQK